MYLKNDSGMHSLAAFLIFLNVFSSPPSPYQVCFFSSRLVLLRAMLEDLPVRRHVAKYDVRPLLCAKARRERVCVSDSLSSSVGTPVQLTST